jgi:FkbM family methyltransferase
MGLRVSEMNNAKLEVSDQMGLSRCRHGLFVYSMKDTYIGKSLEVYGEYSEYEAAFLCSMLKPGAVVIEVGANIGSLTVPIAKAVGVTEGAVIAYEPQRQSFQMLCANVVLNGLPRVITKNAAVGQRSGFAICPDITSATGNFGGIAVMETTESPFATPIVRLDDEGVVPNLIKVDVEGMEVDVIIGAKRLITESRPALYVENDRPDKSKELVGTLIGLGYECRWHTPPLFNPDNWRKSETNLWPGIASFNMICVPRELKANFADEAITVEEAIHPVFR